MEECLGVIADDLSGAMDTAGAFASAGLRTAVALTPSSSIEWNAIRTTSLFPLRLTGSPLTLNAGI